MSDSSLANGGSGTDLVRLTAADTAASIRRGDVTAVEVAQAHLAQIAKVDPLVKAFLHIDADGALEAAASVDEARAAGEALGPLAGVPLAMKDVVVTKGLPTTSGSKILEGWRPPYDATITTRIKDAGIVMLGKTNMDEFAMGSSTENSAYGPTHNPWDLTKIPGGSSGGSSAAVAAFEAPLAIGTDTGGSIRQPAAVTGIVGFKPTYGAVSRYGLIAFSSSLDQAGPFARTVEDTALLYDVLHGHDPCDSTSIAGLSFDATGAARAGAAGDLTGVRVGVVRELGGEGYQAGVTASFDDAVATLKGLGAEIVEVSCPNFEYALAAYYLIAPSECSSNLARFDAVRYGLRVGDDGSNSLEEVMSLTRAAGFGPEVKRRIMIGTYALSSGYYEAYYGQAQKVRTLIVRDFQAAFEKVDVLISPATPVVAFGIGEVVDPITMYRNDLCTLPASLAGTPAISVPCGLSDGLPVGLQIMAPALADERCFGIAAAFERATGILQIPAVTA
ncbi:Asp-tRNA(Asn)/Glu-tRNA(Gln) amidotransferase subunit GatA [Jatrophihabitans sp.]|uniref:Asp-tRNA(Asn)/Glu-tRNA(Gln) amidotransferase subunit GatA n=1 Tax=Jatrophihabitans sp. TaxID=1932789 RepID=UPI0030C6D55F|nr:glutamyl-tRNA(Gln) amidotransferase, subunit [Jatrophihabitans sp.]